MLNIYHTGTSLSNSLLLRSGEVQGKSSPLPRFLLSQESGGATAEQGRDFTRPAFGGAPGMNLSLICNSGKVHCSFVSVRRVKVTGRVEDVVQ